MNYLVFYSHGRGTELAKGWHIGWLGKFHRCSKYGPFATEDRALRVLERLKADHALMFGKGIGKPTGVFQSRW